MALSVYQVTIPVFIRMLNNLSDILTKALHHANAKKIDPAVFINARLYPDMFPLVKQVQITTDIAKACGARLSEMEIPSYPDTETSFAQLHERLAKTIHFLKGIPDEQFNGCEGRKIVVKTPNRDIHFNGQEYVLGFALPNFYFHMTTAYDILRHNGLEIGKADFLGAV